jgi:hypothetical protein
VPAGIPTERDLSYAGSRSFSDIEFQEPEMARKVQVLLEDDIDGTPGAETVVFSLDGKSYEIDLSEKNAEKLREAFAPWIGAGRRASIPAATETRRRPARRSEDTADIRRWAAENGIPVSTRGRISADLRARYEAAH